MTGRIWELIRHSLGLDCEIHSVGYWRLGSESSGNLDEEEGSPLYRWRILRSIEDHGILRLVEEHGILRSVEEHRSSMIPTAEPKKQTSRNYGSEEPSTFARKEILSKESSKSEMPFEEEKQAISRLHGDCCGMGSEYIGVRPYALAARSSHLARHLDELWPNISKGSLLWIDAVSTDRREVRQLLQTMLEKDQGADASAGKAGHEFLDNISALIVVTAHRGWRHHLWNVLLSMSQLAVGVPVALYKPWRHVWEASSPGAQSHDTMSDSPSEDLNAVASALSSTVAEALVDPSPALFACMGLILGILIVVQYKHNRESQFTKPLVLGAIALGCAGALLLPVRTDAAPLTRATATIPLSVVLSFMLTSIIAGIQQLWRG